MITAEKLKSLTDSALFETIANAVLRYKFPSLENIIVTGLNEKGETIKDAMDAFSEIAQDHFAMIHHTINDSDLKRKWLSKGTPKSGKGDLLKAIESAIKIRSLRPKSIFTIYLVTNQRIPSDLQIEVSSANPHGFIRIVFVDISILTSFLDHIPQGQYLRKQYLQIDAELLSQNLLDEIIRKNLAQYKAGLFPINTVVIKTIGIDAIQENMLNSLNQLKLLVSDSGFGKSTAAYYLMEQFLSEKKNALRITPQVIEQSNSFTEAVANQLKVDYPKLFIQPEVTRELFTGSSLIVIDDINQHAKPQVLLDKIISWTLLSGEPHPGMTVLCPLWQKNYRQLEVDLAKKHLYDTVTLEKLSKKDSYELVKNSIDGKVTLSTSQIHSVINDVQTDPLLLKLYCSEIIDKGAYVPNLGQHIIYSFINRKLRSQAAEEPFGELQLATAIEKMGIYILQNRILNPKYVDLQKWFDSEPIVLSAIEAISKHRELFYFDNTLLLFRHDRIRDAILVLSCQKLLSAAGENENILKDPLR